MLLDLRTAPLVDQRPLLDVVVEAVADAERADRGLEPLDERVVDPGLHEDAVRADAGLAGVAELRRHRPFDRTLEVGVVEDDQRRVAAELERDLLHGRRALREQQPPDLGRAREAECAHGRAVRDHVADHRRLAGDDVEDARRAVPRGARARPAPAPSSGVSVAGLSTSVQPAASAGPALRVIIAIGKFHGVIAAATPTGWRTVSTRRPAAFVGIVSPYRRFASSANHSMNPAP